MDSKLNFINYNRLVKTNKDHSNRIDLNPLKGLPIDKVISILLLGWPFLILFYISYFIVSILGFPFMPIVKEVENMDPIKWNAFEYIRGKVVWSIILTVIVSIFAIIITIEPLL